MDEGYKLTHHEIKVMKMAGDRIPWEKGAWVNACVEFLSGINYLTKEGYLTEAGRDWLDAKPNI